MTVASLLEQLKWDINVSTIDIVKAAFKIKLAELDAMITDTDSNAIWTELINQDWIVEQVIDTSATLVAVAERNELTSYTDKIAVVEQALCAQFPNILCYSRITFKPENDTTNPKLQATVDVTVANTGVEALSAKLANEVASTEEERRLREEQLEFLQLLPELTEHYIDAAHQLEQARHANGFKAIAAGHLWTIRQQRNASSEVSASVKDLPDEQVILDENVATALDLLNSYQADYDNIQESIESLRQQTYADWYKYMLATYPPDASGDEYPSVDKIKSFISTRDINQLKNLIIDTNQLAQDLAAQYAVVNTLITVHNDANANESPYIIKAVNAPRYWQAKDPVVLMTGDAVTVSERYGQDGRLHADDLLTCDVLNGSGISYPLVKNNNSVGGFDNILEKIDALESVAVAAGQEHIAFREWTIQPWHPIWLEWQVEFFPLKEGSNHSESRRDYADYFITDNYTLDTHASELTLQAKKGALAKGANIYHGRSILTPHANVHLRKRLADFLHKHLPNSAFDNNVSYQGAQDSTVLEVEQYLTNNITDFVTEYTSTHDDSNHDIVYTALKSYQTLLQTSVLSQSLGGFNNALLMHKQTFQLPIADTLAFEDVALDYAAFTDQIIRDAVSDVQVKDASGQYQSLTLPQSLQDLQQALQVTLQQGLRNNQLLAPQPLNDFNPIRSGAFKLINMRLVDSFGQTKTLATDKVITPISHIVEKSHDLVHLPPRFSQPARLNFRWLSAQHDDQQEMNEHPASSPICGWFVPNHLDNSLLVYEAEGHALGMIDQYARWHPAPGENDVTLLVDISNRYLQDVVRWLVSQGETFINHFMTALDNATQQMEPDTATQHADIALLMGKPLAVVRAKVDVALQGSAAIHQGWNNFRLDLTREHRDSDAFDFVDVPIRLGEYRLYNDGLVGYWQAEDDQTFHNGVFYSPQTNTIDNDAIVTHAEEDHFLKQSINDDAALMTMLIDPRAAVHATCGMLPVKSISIPPEQYVSALQSIEISFLVSPMLAAGPSIHLSLPSEAGYTWRWLEHNTQGWRRLSTIGTIEEQQMKPPFIAINKSEFDGIENQNMTLIPTSGWQAVIDSGWIKCMASEPTKAMIVPIEQRTSVTLDSALDDFIDAIETFFIGHNVWQHLVAKGWLVEAPVGKATIVARDKRSDEILDSQFVYLTPAIEKLFA
ncbi:MAG: hypothetical protein JKY13_01695, partial [Gammaproteobacteria bacterium]|nr:hypothetical protein [Gammaproteobacteria bacterium]